MSPAATVANQRRLACLPACVPAEGPSRALQDSDEDGIDGSSIDGALRRMLPPLPNCPARLQLHMHTPLNLILLDLA
jgi:hypothetical protein